ncbi:hypothetical protein FRZ40_32185 [Paraburkholderia azotifigens]|uniref:Uncharacterized protein n=1 Tax=Paraburkholderia azotifigens TaxID=2057004 RepID=A0A5C6V0P9_9BURK|nr:hypothetical protein FRZ40_32185 [Paraburkholderia azotifigens]
MKSENLKSSQRSEALWAVAEAIEGATRAIRRARNKLNPEDCPPGSQLRQMIIVEFLNDCIQSIGEDVEGESSGG